MEALTQQTGARIAEVGFLLLLIAGIWLVAAEPPEARFKRGDYRPPAARRGWAGSPPTSGM